MTNRATSTFEIIVWEPVEYQDQEGVKQTRTHVTKSFHGDLEGESTAELLIANAPSGSAVYVGLEHIAGTLAGREGSFVLVHDASMSGDVQSLSLVIMRDSGTGGLRGIRGSGDIAIAPDGVHTFTLEYDLG